MPSAVSEQKKSQLRKRMRSLGIREADIAEKFIKGSGRGGQKINKTSSCVYLRHRPTGIEVKCQSERSQALNRFIARRRLCDKIAEKLHGEKTKRQQEIEKIRRQKRRRTRRQKERMLADKKKQAEKKKRRTPISEDQD